MHKTLKAVREADRLNCFMHIFVIIFLKKNGRLAQLVEHLFDVERVIGSNPVPPTKIFTTCEFFDGW